jgi:hypothetical protein
MSATASDYMWFEDRPEGLSEAYCLTLARGLTPAEFLRRIGSHSEWQLQGIDALFEPSMNIWSEYPAKGLFIGVTTIPGDDGDWALGVEINGYLGVTPEVMMPLSVGTRIVTHSRDIEAVDRFYWVEDGDVRLAFTPLSACYREGSTPDAVVDLMREVGFDVSEADAEADHPTEAALALAERLTGVHLTPEFLEQATYTCGVARDPQL